MSAPLPELVPCIFVRPPDMTDEEAEKLAVELMAVPRRFILGYRPT